MLLEVCLSSWDNRNAFTCSLARFLGVEEGATIVKKVGDQVFTLRLVSNHKCPIVFQFVISFQSVLCCTSCVCASPFYSPGSSFWTYVVWGCVLPHASGTLSLVYNILYTACCTAMLNVANCIGQDCLTCSLIGLCVCLFTCCVAWYAHGLVHVNCKYFLGKTDNFNTIEEVFTRVTFTRFSSVNIHNGKKMPWSNVRIIKVGSVVTTCKPHLTPHLHLMVQCRWNVTS